MTLPTIPDAITAAATARARRGAHWSPDGHGRHPGARRDCLLSACVNDADEAVRLTPDEMRALGIEWRPKPTPLRGWNGQVPA